MTQEIDTQLTDAIEAGTMRHRVETRTAMPGTVVAYNAGPPEYCKVELGFRRVTTDGQEVDQPKVDRVPICWPGAAGFTVSCDLVKGNELLCVVSDRALDRWLDQGGVITPASGRLHDPSDIVAIPGLRSAKNAVRATRGRNTLYLGSDSGAAPWMRLRRTPTTQATVEAAQILLGQGAALGVARLNDQVRASTVVDGAAPIGLFEWMTAVTTFINGLVPGTLPGVPSFIGKISQASSKVSAE